MLQIPDIREFVLVPEASDVAILAVLHQRMNGALAHISYYSRLLTEAETKYSIYEHECLAVLFGCERCRSYLKQEFELHATTWLCVGCCAVKDENRLTRCILRFAPFKFKVKHTRGVDNVVTDALCRIFEGSTEETLRAVVWRCGRNCL
jgi:hypothetical protein